MSQKSPRRSNALKMFVRDLSFAPSRRYVDVQRELGRIFTVGKVDVDIDQLISRTFLCDRHRCIQWTPHEKKKDARPLIDNSCCSRYSVPVTDFDREKLLRILPLVKKRLGKDHPLNADRDAAPFELDSDYAFVMREQENGACQFALYEQGMTTCAVHKTCLEEKLPVWEFKPLSCSLWPLALLDYDRDGEDRYLLTIYSDATSGLFDDEDSQSNDESHFACLVDQSPDYDPLYKTMQGVIEQVLGADFYRTLDKYASKLARR